MQQFFFFLIYLSLLSTCHSRGWRWGRQWYAEVLLYNDTHLQQTVMYNIKVENLNDVSLRCFKTTGFGYRCKSTLWFSIALLLGGHTNLHKQQTSTSGRAWLSLFPFGWYEIQLTRRYNLEQNPRKLKM